MSSVKINARVGCAFASCVASRSRRFSIARELGRGFTLVEIMLVLALIVAIGALTWPAIRGSMEGLRLKKSAETIRAVLAEARLAAMTSGTIHSFRYHADGKTYVIEPWESLADATERAANLSAGDPFASSGASQSSVRTTIRDELPDSIFFIDSATIANARSSAAEGAIDPQAISVGDYSTPILFYPDGSSSDARVSLGSEIGRAITITLRALTGAGTIGELQYSDESAGARGSGSSGDAAGSASAAGGA